MRVARRNPRCGPTLGVESSSRGDVMSLDPNFSIRLTIALAVMVGAFAGLGCRTSDKGVRPMVKDGGGDGPMQDGGFRETAPNCSTTPVDKKSDGVGCACNEECGSGFCVDGVCCNSLCNGTCMACNVASSKGTCSPVPDGETPRIPGQCQAEPAATCGLDGTCNGAGGCRKFVDGSICDPGTCQGSSVVGAKVCSEGECVAGPTTICSPFACDATGGRCHARCTDDYQCDGRQCVAGSCGKKPLGAVCTAGDECDSGSCADGVCCNVSCTGPCVSCNQVVRMGECSPVAAGARDPHAKCAEEARTTCGLSGLCNGLGGCAKHAAGTECLAPSCSSGSEIPMSICDGNGTCLVGAPVPCAPFICSGTSCNLSCASANDCTAGNACTGGSCGKFPPGARCTTAGECASGFCVDGYCCNSACSATCENCGLPTARGRCTAVGSGAVDPRGVCKDNGPAACGTNGRCNGNRGCQTYANGIPCRASSCNPTTHSYTQDGTCRNGACSVPAATSCAPFKCNGANCGRTCSSNNDCQAPATCVNGSCGLKPLGSACSRANECLSNQCAQGVCCNSACSGSCFSCNQTGMAGTCTAVPSGGPDPAGVCTNQGQASCGNDGTCNGLGGCKKYTPGSICAAASCTGGVARSASTCNNGACVAGATRTCAPYVCNAAGTDCTASCSTSSQCLPPNTCSATGSCGTKGNGATCSAANECTSGNCVEGFCCNSACTDGCKSCAVIGAQGTCTNVPAGAVDPKSGCPGAAPSTCGNTGFCDGGGACQKHGMTAACRNASCSGSTLTSSGTCTGSGTCSLPTTSSCAPFMCNSAGTACLQPGQCTGNPDCTPGNICVLGICMGKIANGGACSGGGECISGNCVSNICCDTPCTGSCKSCGSGTCTPTPAGQPDPKSMCTGGSGCDELINECNGMGECRKTATAPCGTTTCTGNSVQAQRCNGTGTCVNSTPTPCANPTPICTGGTCVGCSSDGQCSAAGGFCNSSGSCSALCSNDGQCGAGNRCTIGGACEPIPDAATDTP
jgi:hypothetical protein